MIITNILATLCWPCLHYIFCSVEELPFGGVGSSGMGAYHGKHGFDTFTHYKVNIFSSMALNPINIWLIRTGYQPYLNIRYNIKLQKFAMNIKMKIIKFILVLLAQAIVLTFQLKTILQVFHLLFVVLYIADNQPFDCTVNVPTICKVMSCAWF